MKTVSFGCSLIQRYSLWSNRYYISRLLNFLDCNFLTNMPLSKPLTEKEVQKLQKEFLELDGDGDGTITVKELENALRSMRSTLNVSGSEIKRVLKDIDKDGDGTIDGITFFHSGYAAEWGGIDSYGTSYEGRVWSHKVRILAIRTLL